jgi:hypothetical protein
MKEKEPKLTPQEIKDLLETEWSSSQLKSCGEIIGDAEKIPYGKVEGKFSGTEVRMTFHQK